MSRQKKSTAKSKPTGRPRLAVPKDAVLYIRFTAEERERIDVWAAKCNRSAPEWARLVVLRCLDARVEC